MMKKFIKENLKVAGAFIIAGVICEVGEKIYLKSGRK